VCVHGAARIGKIPVAWLASSGLVTRTGIMKLFRSRRRKRFKRWRLEVQSPESGDGYRLKIEG
jgi:hypothetical protein